MCWEETSPVTDMIKTLSSDRKVKKLHVRPGIPSGGPGIPRLRFSDWFCQDFGNVGIQIWESWKEVLTEKQRGLLGSPEESFKAHGPKNITEDHGTLYCIKDKA